MLCFQFVYTFELMLKIYFTRRRNNIPGLSAAVDPHLSPYFLFPLFCLLFKKGKKKKKKLYFYHKMSVVTTAAELHIKPVMASVPICAVVNCM